MKFVSIRELRTRPGEVRQQLQQEGELILTSRGRPFALMIAAEGEDVEELLGGFAPQPRPACRCKAAQARRQRRVGTHVTG